MPTAFKLFTGTIIGLTHYFMCIVLLIIYLVCISCMKHAFIVGYMLVGDYLNNHAWWAIFRLNSEL